METLRIREKDGEFKVEKRGGPKHVNHRFVEKRTGRTWYGLAKFEKTLEAVYSDPKWEPALFFDEEGDVTTISKYLPEYSFAHLLNSPAIFESKEHAIEWIEHFWGQQYTLEDGEWRTA